MNALQVPSLIMAALMVAGPASPAAPAQGVGRAADVKCVSAQPVPEFYEAGRKATFPITVPNSACMTISVSHIKDTASPTDRCQTFLVGFFPPDGEEATYTEPVIACSEHLQTRTVLAWGVPDGVVYRILYQVEYLEPTPQTVTFKVWH